MTTCDTYVYKASWIHYAAALDISYVHITKYIPDTKYKKNTNQIVLNKVVRLQWTPYDTLWDYTKHLESSLYNCTELEWMLSWPSILYILMGQEIRCLQLYFVYVLYYCLRCCLMLVELSLLRWRCLNCFGWNRTYLQIVGIKLPYF